MPKGNRGGKRTVLPPTPREQPSGKYRSLISERERSQREVDAVLTVLRDYAEKYGVTTHTEVGRLGTNVMGHYDYGAETLRISTPYFDMDGMDKAWDEAVNIGFHPSRGQKSGMEATVAHEMGHKLSWEALKKSGYGANRIGKSEFEHDVILSAKRRAGYSGGIGSFRQSISGYASRKDAEAIAESFADVYCNGDRANPNSKAIVAELESRL